MNQITKEYREKIAELFVRSLEEEQLDWKKNWSGLGVLPENAITGKKYKGINSFWLGFQGKLRESTDPRWATFKQIQDAGWKLNRGAKGAKIEYWQPYDFEKKKGLSWADYRVRVQEEQVGLIAKYYTVFNARDITGIPERVVPENVDVKVDELVTWLSENMNVEIVNDGGDRAFYSPSEDKIHLPIPEHFLSEYDYNVTALHELSHSTGAAYRLNRDLSGGFGSSSYAYEELVAEISSCFMGEYLDVQQSAQHIDNHKAYVQSWIQQIKEKPETLIKAIRDAGNVANYMEYQAGLIDEKEYLLLEDDNLQVSENKIIPETTVMEHQIPEKSFLNQIDKFYANRLGKYDIITVGKTPGILLKLGAKNLPVQIKQSTLRKIIRKPDANKSASAHGLPRKTIEEIPELIKGPAIVVKDPARNSLVLISDSQAPGGYPLLLALKMDEKVKGMFINEIKSLYGKTALVEYLNKQPVENVIIADMKKAKMISRAAGLQLPATWKSLDYDNNVHQNTLKVNKNFTEKADICKDLKQHGFTPNNAIVEKIQKLERIKQNSQSLQDICDEFKQGCMNSTPEAKELINSIAKECQAQELSKVLPEPGQ